MNDAQLYRYDEVYGEVSYYDTATGVYLFWSKRKSLCIQVVAQDQRRTLGEFSTGAQTVEQAARRIRVEINTPGKPYGERAGLWDAG